MSADPCTIDGCDRPSWKRAGLEQRLVCRGHYARHLKGKPLDEPLRHWAHPLRSVMEAAFAFADAEGDDEFRRAWWRLKKAGKRAFGPKSQPLGTK